MTLISFIVPVFNEEKNVIGTFEALRNAAGKIPNQFELIFVDDCSTDKTKLIIYDLKKQYSFVRIVENKKNLGFGSCFLEGAKIAEGKYLQIVPGDNCFSAEELQKIVDELKNDYDWILADNKDLNNSRLWIRELISRIFVWTVSIMFFKNFRYYNGIHVVKKTIFQELKINSKGPVLLCEILLKMLKKTNNYKIVRVYFTERTEGKSKIFNIKTIIKAIYELIYLRITY